MHASWMKMSVVGLLAFVLVVTACGGRDSLTVSPGTGMLALARQAKARGEFTTATGLYRQARTLLTNEGKNDAALECLNSLRDIQLITAQYPYRLGETRAMLADAFPQVTPEEREAWITQGKLESTMIDGESRFFSDFISNVKFRNVDLFRQDANMYKGFEDHYKLLKQVVDAGPGADPWQPFIRPISYTATYACRSPGQIARRRHLETVVSHRHRYRPAEECFRAFHNADDLCERFSVHRPGYRIDLHGGSPV